MKDVIILITGSTDGIGKETAIELAKSGAHVIIHGRNDRKAKLVVEEIKEKTSISKIDYVYADLSSLAQIKDISDNLYAQFDTIDVLINNAGVFRPIRNITQDGLEETFAVNYIAPFYLTNLILDLIIKATSGRIINVVSQVHSNHLDFDDLQLRKEYSGTKAYALSKTCLIMFIYLLAEKLKNTKLKVNCLHPGVINTKLLGSAMGFGGAPVSKGAESLIYVAMAPELENISGKYFRDNIPTSSKDITYDKEKQKQLWQKTEKIIGRKFNIF